MKENKQYWWGYLHKNKTIQVKRYWNDPAVNLSIDDAHQSPFVVKVINKFEASSREEAIQYIKRSLFKVDSI